MKSEKISMTMNDYESMSPIKKRKFLNENRHTTIILEKKETSKGFMVKKIVYGEMVEMNVEKRKLNIGNKHYEYWFADIWPSLGTYIAEGMEYGGIEGPCVVISSQIQDLLDRNGKDPLAIATVLHEFGHMQWDQEFREDIEKKEQRSFTGYSLAEIQANVLAIKNIIKNFKDEDWANESLKYF